MLLKGFNINLNYYIMLARVKLFFLNIFPNYRCLLF